MKSLDNFLDAEGRLKNLPRKSAPREEAYAYLAGKFDPGVEYTEHDVNAILSAWHTFDDFFTLRRGLVETGYLCRMKDGSKYWRNPERELPQNPPGEEA